MNVSVRAPTATSPRRATGSGPVIPQGGDTDTITYHEFRGPFTVTVVAVDLAGNASAPSNAITVSTQGGGCF